MFEDLRRLNTFPLQLNILLFGVGRSPSVGKLLSFYLQYRKMIFRRSKSCSITLQRAHSLLKIPREPSSTIRDQLTQNSSSSTSVSRDQIKHAFRAAAKLHHPDLVRGGAGSALLGTTAKILSEAASATAPLSKVADTTIRECYEARELLLDYYVYGKAMVFGMEK